MATVVMCTRHIVTLYDYDKPGVSYVIPTLPILFNVKSEHTVTTVLYRVRHFSIQ